MRVLAGLVVFLLLGVGFVFALSGSCPAARLDGVLVESPPGELGIRADGGEIIYSIKWSLGSGVRRLDDERLAVADLFGFGGVKAVAGDHVGIGGGMDPQDESRWAVCGTMDSLGR